MENKDLKKIYNDNDLDFYTGFNEAIMLATMVESWQGLSVLEIGCGKGTLASMLAGAGARVWGIDYAEEEIKKAKHLHHANPKLTFKCMDHKEMAGKYDVVVMQGVLEHLDTPFKALLDIITRNVKPGGCVLLSVPGWLNPRGFVYHACRLIFDAKMSLTDLHFFLPDDFQNFGVAHNYEITFLSTDFSRGNGAEAVKDLEKRLPLACPDVPLKNFKVFTELFGKMIAYWQPGSMDGANLGVKVKGRG